MKKILIAFISLLLIISSCKLKEDTTGTPDNGGTENPSLTAIKVVKPNGGESLSEGSSYEINWTGSGSVRIQFSADNGSTWSNVVDSLKGTGVYTWFPVPNQISNQCRIRVSTVDGVSADASDQVFTIVKNSNKSLSVNSPKKGDEWEAGTAKQIKWFSSGIDSVKIDYTTDNGNHWNFITVDKKNTGIYFWEPVPNTPSFLSQVRITDAFDNKNSAESDLFSILPESKLTVLSPNGGETVLAGTSRDIKWKAQNIENVKIAYTTDYGFRWTTIVETTPNIGYYSWNPVPNLNSKLCLVQIYDAKDGQPNDVSDSTFTITNQIIKTLELQYPIGGEKFRAGESPTIRWVSSGINKVNILFTKNNWITTDTIVSKTDNVGSYDKWTVPDFGYTASSCKIRVTDVSGEPKSESKSSFTITPKPNIWDVYPNSGASWVAGVVDTIRWKSIGVDNIFLEFTADNGKSWNQIVSKTAANGLNGKYPYSFSAPGTQYRIHAVDADYKFPEATSSGTFTVTNEPKITVVSPNGNEEWYSGSSNNIKWVSTNIENVKIEYSTNNGASWNLIVASTPSNGLYAWNSIPNVSSLQCRIRISNAANGIPNDISDDNFTITSQGTKLLKVKAPNGGEVWPAGTSQNITWDGSGIANVKIEYTSNNGNNWNTIIASTQNTGFYTWNQIPTGPSTICKVRISDVSPGGPSDESDSFFTIGPAASIKIIVPNGNDTWIKGTSKEINWTSENVVNVKIEYTTNAGGTWNTIVNSTPSTGSYIWQNIPDANNSLQCRIKISEAVYGTPSAISADNFAIMNSGTQEIKVVSPNGKESWGIGSSQNILWDAGGIANVKIEYTTNNGISWNLITASTPSNGYYTWNPIPNSQATNCKVRVSDASDGTPSDESDAFFTIGPAPSIKVVTPNGNDTWLSGSNKEIKWTSENVVNVKIEFTSNAGGTWNTIISSTPSSGSYTWNNIPQTNNSLQCRIRISEADTGSPFDLSDDNFAIMSPGAQQIKVVAPNGGEKWNVGSLQNIIWDAGGIANVKIEYTTNNGLLWNTIIASTPSNGYYTWNPVPNTLGTNCLVRISDAADGDPVDLSDNSFSILPTPSIKVVSPGGGETIQYGVNTEIKWTSENVGFVKIEYTTNGGATWNLIVNSVESTGSYIWTSVPNINSYQCRIRISDSSNGASSDISKDNFTITNQVAQSIKVTYPVGGEKFQAGTTQTITWTSSNIPKVRLEFTSNSGLTWNLIIYELPNTGAYDWNVPNYISTQCLIKISDAVDGDPSDQSSAFFRIILKPELKVLKPNGGEVLPAGIQDTIKWSSVGVDNVFIEYTTNNGSTWNTVVNRTPSIGAYLTSFTSPSNQYKIRISDADNHSPQDESDGTFTVTPEPSVTVVSPNGGEEWYAGSSNNIKWTSNNIENVKIEYTTNNGGSWTTITNSTPSNGVYSWNQIPQISTLQCRIRISDAKDGIPADISDNNFIITQPGIQLIKITSPNGSENWPAGTSQNITWDASGITNVKIEYTNNNGISWNLITANTPSTGFYTWTQVPNAPSTNCKVRISDALDGAPSATSDNFFTIAPAPSIVVVSPNGNDTWLSGTNREIKWTSQNVTNVKIEYTSNGGGTWSTIVASTPSSGSFMWNNIPDLNNSLQCRIKISDAQNGTPSDLSDDNFAVMNPGAQQIKVLSPNGKEEWNVGSTQNIIWDAGGIANVKIEYTTNNGLNWGTIVASTPSNGYYTWNPIPNTPATNCKIRISDAADGDPVDLSDNTFSILPKPTIVVVAPNGGESIQTGTTTEIRWTSENVSFVKIEYTTNGGATWNTITNSTESIGTFLWSNIPNINSLQCRIRISDASNGTSADISDANFQISNQVSQSIRVISPDGGEKWQAGSPKNITWDSKAINAVKIELTTNNGLSWFTIVDNYSSSGSYEWNIPSLNSTQCKVRVSDAADGDPYDESNSSFTIKPIPSLVLLNPTNGEEIFAGEPYKIKWTSQGIEYVKIQYNPKNSVVNADWITIADSVPNGNQYITSFTIESEGAVIRIGEAGSNSNYFYSGVFKVKPSPKVTIISPNGGEKWLVGNTYKIAWTATNVENVKIELSTNGGFSWKPITNSTPNDGSLDAYIPGSRDSSDNCVIRISDVADGTPSDQSNSNFSIRVGNGTEKFIKIIFPNGGERCMWGEQPYLDFVWTSYGITSVKVEISLDNGLNWQTVSNNYPSTGLYSWTLFDYTNIYSSQARIRVTEITNPPNIPKVDESDGIFFINTKNISGKTLPNNSRGNIKTSK